MNVGFLPKMSQYDVFPDAETVYSLKMMEEYTKERGEYYRACKPF